MPRKVDYPAIKKAAWEAWRVFIPAFLAVVYAQFQAGVDLKEGEAWLLPLVGAAGVAGVKAVAKWYREEYAKGEYDRFIYKIPA